MNGNMKKRNKYGNRYPWDAWFGIRIGATTTLKRGIHYECRTDSMAQMVRFASKRYKIKVSINIGDAQESLTIERVE